MAVAPVDTALKLGLRVSLARNHAMVVLVIDLVAEHEQAPARDEHAERALRLARLEHARRGERRRRRAQLENRVRAQGQGGDGREVARAVCAVRVSSALTGPSQAKETDRGLTHQCVA